MVGTIISVLILALGIIGIVVFLVLLAVQLVRKKKVKAVKPVLILSSVLVVLGAVLTFITGGIKMDLNPRDDTGSAENNLKEFDCRVGDVLSFTTTDADGNSVDSSIFKDSKVTMINRWEPWCNPCKEEMPELEALYQQYRDKGFNIIGVYSEEDGLSEALSLTGVTYPILRAGEEWDKFGNNIPATIFVDSEGRILELSKKEKSILGTGAIVRNNCVLIGARDGASWEAIIKYFLEK